MSLLRGLVPCLLVLAACRQPPRAPEDVVLPPCPDASALTGDTFLFAISELRFDSHDVPLTSPHFGFDLDDNLTRALSGLTIASCGTEDSPSTLDPDQNCTEVDNSGRCRLPRDRCTNDHAGCVAGTEGCEGGVDNNVAHAEAALRDIRFLEPTATAIAQNREAILIAVFGVDSLVDDPAVRVRVVRAFPTFAMPCDHVPMDGEYQVDESSLRPGGTSIRDALLDVPGSIVGGRLRIAASDTDVVPFRWFVSSTRVVSPPLDTPLHRVTIGMHLDSSAVTNGNLGAWIGTPDFENWLQRIDPMNDLSANILVQPVTDLAPGIGVGPCFGTVTELQFGGISVGLGFSAVRAHLHPTQPLAAAPATGSCASPDLADGGMH